MTDNKAVVHKMQAQAIRSAVFAVFPTAWAVRVLRKQGKIVVTFYKKRYANVAEKYTFDSVSQALKFFRD